VAALAIVAVLVDGFLVGLSRVVLNAHWPSDAIAAALAAAGVLGIYGAMTHGNAWATKRHGKAADGHATSRSHADHGHRTADAA
jgi:membrane-associated phospholipid phosphatase